MNVNIVSIQYSVVRLFKPVGSHRYMYLGGRLTSKTLVSSKDLGARNFRYILHYKTVKINILMYHQAFKQKYSENDTFFIDNIFVCA